MKDLLRLLIFKKLYPETEHKARIVDAFTGVIIWTCFAIALHFFIKTLI